MFYYLHYGMFAVVLLLFSGCSGFENGSSTEGDITTDPELTSYLDEIQSGIGHRSYNELDSLIAISWKKTEDLEDFPALIELKKYKVATLMHRRRFQEALSLLDESQVLIEEYGSARDEMQMLIQRSQIYTDQGRVSEALEVLDRADELVPAVDDQSDRARLLATRARALTKRNPVEAVQLYYQALVKFQQTGQLENELLALNNIGLIHHDQGNFISALEAYNMALEISIELDNKLHMAMLYNNISNSLSESGDKEEAADILMKAIGINQELGINPGLIQNYYNLANLYYDLDDLEQAHALFTTGYSESRSIQFLPGIMHHASGLARILFKMERYDEVPGVISESREIAQRLSEKNLIAEGWDIESRTSEALGDYENALMALRQQNRYAARIDSVRREREFREIQAKHELNLKTSENELLRRELQYRDHLSRNQRFLLFAMGAGILTTIILLIVLYSSKRKMEKANAALEQKNSVITHKNEQLRDLNSELQQLHEEKGRLVDIIIHDLRNPLFGVIGFLELMEDAIRDETQKGHLQMALKSAKRLNLLVNSLLEVQTLEKETNNVKLTRQRVDEVAESTIGSFRETARKKDIEVRTSLEELEAHTDASYLSRIIENLVSNAIKFSPRHSKVHVSLMQSGEDRWQIAVEDEGPGISKDDREKMFRMFGRLTARPTGGEDSTGLGLYTVQLLTGRLNGGIDVESEPGKGSRFICHFPVHINSHQ